MAPTLISAVSGSNLFVQHTSSLNSRVFFLFFFFFRIKTCTFLASYESSFSEETTETMFLLLKREQNLVVSAVVCLQVEQLYLF